MSDGGGARSRRWGSAQGGPARSGRPGRYCPELRPGGPRGAAPSPARWAGVGLLAVAFTVGGVLFPVMMNLLQSLTTSARGTVSALASVLMYAGSTLAGVIGGPLLTALPSFWGVSLLALGTTLVALGLWTASGSLRT